MLSFAAFGVMVAVAIAYIASLGVRIGLPPDRTDLSMTVADVSGLVVGSKVLLRGAPVGEVSAIETSVGAATVHFYIREPFRVPDDSEFRLENLSALQESYIGLVPRTASRPALRDGQRIDPESVIAPASISELAASVTRVLNQLDPAALKRIVGEVDTALPDPNAVLPNLTRTSVLLRNTAADMNGRGRGVLENFQTLLVNTGWVGPTLASLTPQLYHYAPTLSDMFATFPPLIASGSPEPLGKFGDLMKRIQNLLDNNGGDLKVLGDNFQPHITGVAGSLLNFDTGRVFTNLLDSLPQDGVVPLHVSLEGN
jgi:virulence factor Mce-like protein